MLRTAVLALCAALLCGCVCATTESYTWKPVYTGGGGGFVTNIIFHPTTKDVIYARTDVGGAYRWLPATSKWKQLLGWVSSEDWSMGGVESIAVDPSDSKRLYIAAGMYSNGWVSTNGVILRSSDYGETFSITNMSIKMGGNMPGRGIGERLVVDPNLGSILYFGSRNGKGLFKSTNYGVTWTNVTNFPDSGTYRPYASGDLSGEVGIPIVLFDPSSGTSGSATKTIYVAVASTGSSQSMIYRSKDAGATWSAISGQPTCSGTWSGTATCTNGHSWSTGTQSSRNSGGIGYLPKSMKLDSNGVLYVTYSDYEGPYQGSEGAVFKYNGTWTDITPVAKSSLYYGFGGLGVDMLNPGTIVVAGVNSYWPQGVMFRSKDYGSSWTPAWQWTSYPNASTTFEMNVSNAPWIYNSAAVSPVPNVPIGWMMEGLNIDPLNSNRMMYGTGLTLYATYNLKSWGTSSKVIINSEARGIEEAVTLHLVSPPAGGSAHLYTAMGDIAGARHDDVDSPPSTMYSVPDSGTNTWIDFAGKKPKFLVRVGSGIAVTSDGGNTWKAGSNPSSGTQGVVAAAADGSAVVWAASDVAVYYSKNNCSSWTASTGIANGAFVAADRVNPKRFYGLSSSKFYYSTDSGASFTTSSASNMPSSGKVQTVLDKEGDVWVVGSSGVFHSTDGGVSFTQLTTIKSAEVIGFGKAATGASYPAIYISGIVSSGTRTYRSDDAGASWIEISDSSHLYGLLNSISGDPQIYGRVYIAAGGFGNLYGDPVSASAGSSTAATVASSDGGSPTVVSSDGGSPAVVSSDGGSPAVVSSDGGSPAVVSSDGGSPVSSEPAAEDSIGGVSSVASGVALCLACIAASLL